MGHRNRLVVATSGTTLELWNGRCFLGHQMDASLSVVVRSSSPPGGATLLRKAMEDTILSVSPLIRRGLPYLETEAGRTVSGGTRLGLALDEMALLMTPTRRQLHTHQNMRDRLIAIECQD